MNIEEIAAILGSYVHGYLATVDLGGAPDIRGWELQFYKDGSFYFTTSSAKSVYRQLCRCSQVAFACTRGEWHVNLLGELKIVDNPQEIAYVFEHMDENVRRMYADVNDNGFTVLRMDCGTVKYAQGFNAVQILKF